MKECILPLLFLIATSGQLFSSHNHFWPPFPATIYDTITVAACSTYTSPSGLRTWTTSGVYQDTLFSSIDDTVLTINLTIGYQPSVNILIENACGSSYTLNDTTYTISGIHTQILTNAVGCDSVLTVYLNLFYLDTYDTLAVQTCDSYSLNNEMYSSSGLYTQLLTNSLNCDSFLTLDLTILEASDSLMSATACESYTLNDSVYHQSGQYTQVLSNQSGCDSIITLDLTIDSVSSLVLVESSCDSYSLNDSVYLSSGTYTQILTNQHGCDSILTLDLSISQSTQAYLDSIVVCESYSLNDSIYTSSGMYTQLLTNAQGCDSSIFLDLHIDSLTVDLSSDGWGLFAQANFNATYQWVNCDQGYVAVTGETEPNFNPVFNGNYAVVATYGNCRDTSDCIFMNVTSLDQGFENQVSYYPSPSAGELSIDLGHPYKDIEISILNTMGQDLGRYTDQSRQVISIHLPEETGMYYLHIQADDLAGWIKVLRE